MVELDPAARDALAGRLAAAPEDPFLFFRAPRGPFDWWSWRRCAAIADGEPPGPEGAVPAAFLDAALGPLPPAPARAAEELAARTGGGAEREIWLSCAPLDSAAERIAARAALLGGWAVVREPGERIHPETLLWARPTVIVGSSEELETLVTAVGEQAPRWGRARWLRRRLGRLRLVLATGGDAEAATGSLRALGAPVRVLPFAPHGW